MTDEIREKEVALDDAELEDVAGGKRIERVEGVIATGDDEATTSGVGSSFGGHVGGVIATGGVGEVIINGGTGASFGGSGNVGSR